MLSFKVIGLLVLEKKIFFKFFTIYMYGHGSHVGHVTQLICVNFHSHSSLSCFSDPIDQDIRTSEP